MNVHIIENGIVTNTIAVGSLEAARALFPHAVCVDAACGGSIGDSWDGATFSRPPEPAPTRDDLKAARAAAVDAIEVMTAAGNTFDGDETSQGRMARAIIALQATGTASVNWVLSDNSVIAATAAELVEALALAGAVQAAVWVIA